MAWIVVRICTSFLALALAGSVVFAQTAEPENTKPISIAPAGNPRMVSRLVQLADQARGSGNLSFAVRAQSQAAALLWTLDAEQSREIYRRAFESLSTHRIAEDTSGSKRSKPSAEQLEKRQLRIELLNQITARDPKLAELLAREMADSFDNPRSSCSETSSGDCAADFTNSVEPMSSHSSGMRDAAERRELLMSAALQIVERDPQQAMAFGQMSVGLGISQNLSRLLTLLRNVDVDRADLLFANAMDKIQQGPAVNLADIHTLGTYVVSVIHTPSARAFPRLLALRLINFAFAELAKNRYDSSHSIRSEDSATVYFIGRQLIDLSMRFGSDKLDQIRRIAVDSGSGPQSEPLDLSDFTNIRTPGDIAGEARAADNEAQRDSLYARAAIAWLSQRDSERARSAALKITGAGIRDRVLAQIARRSISENRIAPAMDLTERIDDLTARVDLLVLLSNVALSTKDRARAVELLNEADSVIRKKSASSVQTQPLIKLAYCFTELDTSRSFEILETAIRSINEVIKEESRGPESGSEQRSHVEANAVSELCSTSFESTLAALARADFDRALTLAQQLAGDEAPVIAQLAVLRGGLADKGESGGFAEDYADSGIKH